MRVAIVLIALGVSACEEKQATPVVATSKPIPDAGAASGHIHFALPDSAKGGPEIGGGDPSADQIGAPSNVLGNAINSALADGGQHRAGFALPGSAEHGPGVAQPDSRENTHLELRLRDGGLVDPANYHFGEDDRSAHPGYNVDYYENPDGGEDIRVETPLYKVEPKELMH